MGRYYRQKAKLLYLAKILMEETDEQHPIRTKELIERLAAEDIRAERKSIYEDMALLTDLGMDIITIHERPGGYYLASRDFELAELKLLVDAVAASKFITQKKSGELIGKLEQLTSRHDARKLQREVMVTGRVKAENESVFYTVDCLHEAMNSDRKIRFQYFQWSPEKKQELRHGGAFYEVSPWFLTWEDENYYLIAYDDAAEVMKHYRVDKMLHPQVSEEPRLGREAAEGFGIDTYTKKTFGMFAGESRTVIMVAENSLAGVCIDRFGQDVAMRKEDADHVRIRTEVAVSPQFFGWLTGLGPRIRLVSPEDVCARYEQWLEQILENYRQS